MQEKTVVLLDFRPALMDIGVAAGQNATQSGTLRGPCGPRANAVPAATRDKLEEEPPTRWLFFLAIERLAVQPEALVEDRDGHALDFAWRRVRLHASFYCQHAVADGRSPGRRAFSARDCACSCRHFCTRSCASAICSAVILVTNLPRKSPVGSFPYVPARRNHL